MRKLTALIVFIALQGVFAQTNQSPRAQNEPVELRPVALQILLRLIHSPHSNANLVNLKIEGVSSTDVALPANVFTDILNTNSGRSEAYAFLLRLQYDTELQAKLKKFQDLTKDKIKIVRPEQYQLESLRKILIEAIHQFHYAEKLAKITNKNLTQIHSETLMNISVALDTTVDNLLESLVLFSEYESSKHLRGEEIVLLLEKFSEAIHLNLPIKNYFSHDYKHTWKTVLSSLSGTYKWQQKSFRKSFSCRYYFK